MQPLVDTLEAVYRDTVLPRMQDLPVFNAALQVEARGFRMRGSHCSGVLITPWCMNLVLLPVDGERWGGRAPGSRIEVAFPAGTYQLTLSLPAGGEPHLGLTLFTTVLACPDQGTAREVADDILRRLYEETSAPEYEGAAPLNARLDRQELRRPLSRRDLLHGRWAPAAGRET
jgi:[NiFe] hydrogenase assembly HybE family chaperone